MVMFAGVNDDSMGTMEWIDVARQKREKARGRRYPYH